MAPLKESVQLPPGSDSFAWRLVRGRGVKNSNHQQGELHMKKNLIALAVFGAFSGAALAQSNVTLYGIIDVGYRYSDPDASNVSSTKGIDSGIQSGNRWGIRGSEALSPTLNAVFTIEGGFGLDTGTLSQGSAACTGTPISATNSVICSGATQTRIFGRQAWGLSLIHI